MSEESHSDAGVHERPPSARRPSRPRTGEALAGGSAVTGVFARSHEVSRTEIRIGRDSGNGVVVEDLAVSRYHALLKRRGPGEWEVTDLGSANGTFVNGVRIQRAVLTSGDVLDVGRSSFRLVGETLEEFVDDGRVSFRASELTVRTGEGKVLLDRLSFSLEQESFLSVVGPSGSGKSTMLNALTGFRPAAEGSVFYDGRDLYADYDQLRLQLGFVPQEDVLHPQLRVVHALGFAAELRFPGDVDRDTRERRVREVIAELGLEPVAELEVQALSGGQRRRVAVALELMTKPSLLFLDEPTSGLDPGYERSLMQLLRDLAKSGHTVVVVTHAVQSLHMCDRVLVLAPGGQPAYFGPPDLATGYFGSEDYQGVFNRLSAGRGERDWASEFRSHEYFTRFAAEPRPPGVSEVAKPRPPAAKRGEAARAIPAKRSRGRLSQLALLSRRYLRVIAGDRRNLALMVLQPLVLGLLMLAALPAGEFDAPDAGVFRAISRAGLVLLLVVTGATWIGASNGIREIVKERSITRRERAVGLSIGAYIGSKGLVLGVITALQSIVLAGLAMARQGSHGDGSILASPSPELLLIAVGAGLAGLTLALAISALASTTEQAMTVLPVVLVLQMLLAMGGVFPDMVDKPGLKQVSYLAGTQWAFSAAASTVDLDRLQAIDKIAREVPTVRLDDPLESFRDVTDEIDRNRLWRHDATTWLADFGALIAVTLIGLGISAAALWRRRVEVV